MAPSKASSKLRGHRHLLKPKKTAKSKKPKPNPTRKAVPVMKLKLLIDKKGKRVLFAEAGKDFIDFLFSILTLPIGTVIDLLNNKGMVGCIGNLYKSVSDISNDYMQSNQQKVVLLKPMMFSLSSSHQPPLLPLEAMYGRCTLLSPISGAYCRCGCIMSSTVTMYVPKSSSDPVPATDNIGEVAVGFVKGVVTYMVMDDLVVAPMSTISSITLLNKFKVKEVGALEEKVVRIGMDEGLELLKHALCSKKVLTDVFLAKL